MKLVVIVTEIWLSNASSSLVTESRFKWHTRFAEEDTLGFEPSQGLYYLPV